METETDDVRVELLRQEHRLIPLVLNWIQYRKEPWSNPRRQASLKALLWNFIFSATSVAIGAGLLTIAMLVWQNVLLVQNNEMLARSNEMLAGSLNLDGEASATIVAASSGENGYLGADVLVQNMGPSPLFLQEVSIRFLDDELLKQLDLTLLQKRLISSGDAVILKFDCPQKPDGGRFETDIISLVGYGPNGVVIANLKSVSNGTVPFRSDSPRLGGGILLPKIDPTSRTYDPPSDNNALNTKPR